MFRTSTRSAAVPVLAAALLGLATAGAAAVPPSNDLFNRAETLTGCDASVEGDNFQATRQRGEPFHHFRASAPTHSVWYKWRSPVTDTVVMDTIGSDYDTILAVYRGTSFVPPRQLTRIASDDDSGGDLTSLVTFDAQRNVTYRIAVDGYAAAQGNHLVNVTC
jgi:hypothetical protein